MASKMTSGISCVWCKRAVGSAHKCTKCDFPCHIICGKPVGEEGYGQEVICNICLNVSSLTLHSVAAVPDAGFDETLTESPGASSNHNSRDNLVDVEESVKGKNDVEESIKGKDDVEESVKGKDDVAESMEGKNDIEKSMEGKAVPIINVSDCDDDDGNSSTNDNWNFGCIEIPEHLYNIFPPNGQYLIEIMKYCAYSDVESVLELKKTEKRKEMFEFVKEMLDVIEDKEKMLGIFLKIPHKLRMLPGLTHSFDRFLVEVEKLKNPSKTGEKSGKCKRKGGAFSSEVPSQKQSKKQPSAVTVDSLTHQMDGWMKKKSYSQSFTISKSGDDFSFYCKVCNHQAIPLSKSDSKVTVSNAQRHYTKGHCEKLVEKNKLVKNSMRIDSMFPSGKK